MFIYWCYFFFIKYKEGKKDIIKISSNLRNLINFTQHIPTVFFYHCLSKFYKKVTVKKIYSSTFFPLYHLTGSPILPVNSNFFFFTSKFKTSNKVNPSVNVEEKENVRFITLGALLENWWAWPIPCDSSILCPDYRF